MKEERGGLLPKIQEMALKWVGFEWRSYRHERGGGRTPSRNTMLEARGHGEGQKKERAA